MMKELFGAAYDGVRPDTVRHSDFGLPSSSDISSFVIYVERLDAVCKIKKFRVGRQTPSTRRDRRGRASGRCRDRLWRDTGSAGPTGIQRGDCRPDRRGADAAVARPSRPSGGGAAGGGAARLSLHRGELPQEQAPVVGRDPPLGPGPEPGDLLRGGGGGGAGVRRRGAAAAGQQGARRRA